jgi:hypothetical protein
MNILELLLRLEKRLITVEAALGLEAEANTLIHPKSLAQAKAETAAAKLRSAPGESPL